MTTERIRRLLLERCVVAIATILTCRLLGTSWTNAILITLVSFGLNLAVELYRETRVQAQRP